MASPKPFFPTHEPQPIEVVKTEVEWLMCDSCGLEIETGEDAVQFFQGISGVGERSGRPMIVHSGIHPNLQEANLHYGCVANFLIESCSEIVEMILDLSADSDEEAPPDEHFCASCDAKLDPNSD